MLNYVRYLILGISTESYNKRFACQLNGKARGMLVYFKSENAEFDNVSSAYNLRIQALEESDLLGLWHSQFLKIALSVSQTVFIGRCKHPSKLHLLVCILNMGKS